MLLRALSALFHRTLRAPASGEGDVAFWRLRILELMLGAGAALGPLVLVPSFLLALKVRFWSVAAADVAAYAWILAAALSPKWSYRSRAWGILALIYLLSLVLLTRLGSAGAGMLWIGALPVLAAILLNPRAAAVCWGLALATLAGCALAVRAGAMVTGPMGGGPADAFATWVVVSVNALFLSAFIALPTALLLRGLEHTHRALSREEERFTKAFQLSHEPIAISRRSDNRFLDVNESWCRVYGWTREEVLGRTSTDLGIWNAGEDRQRLRAELEATGGIAPRAMELRRKDGAVLPVLLSAKVLDLEGEACLLTLSQDLTATRAAEAERRRLEAELQHAQKLESLGSLAGGVAHDMNNILAAIIGLGSALQEKYAHDAPLARALETILGAGERGRRLVRGLTDFARKGLDDPRPVDLNELVRLQIELLRGTTLARIEISTQLDPDLPAVLGEPSSLGNALMNLCVNAMDAMPQGGGLAFCTGVDAQGRVVLAVEDTGEGMPPEVAARAMEPFFTTKPVGKGTGLGLAGVYGTVKAHGGTLEIESRVGQGTRVILCFPALAPVAGSGSGPAGAPQEREGPPLRILLVDDDPIILETLPSVLGFLGHTVLTAARGQEALDRIGAGLDVDLVVLDHNMPGLSGAETLVRLKELRGTLPVILSTGFLESGVEDLVRSLPGVWLLNKPYALPALRQKLRAVQELR
ncbi:ATP-binding protein [Geothrix sp. 21YS21S-2]|uniref:hybrid sensor histidine kinase/response regulator n=1 Tax=Geothrix sp. 21YS21S-2 TaxID=3068893 RepID=UPI0027B9FD89|nr:ATP-binding protein [Geothrix sp. 21YS21S-2]